MGKCSINCVKVVTSCVYVFTGKSSDEAGGKEQVKGRQHPLHVTRGRQESVIGASSSPIKQLNSHILLQFHP